MKNQVIARELITIAKSLLAGGGAGIDFKFDIDEYINAKVKFNNKKVQSITFPKLPEINKFEAHGYQDGMSNVKGSLFKVVSLKLKDEFKVKKELEELYERYELDDKEIDCDFGKMELDDYMVFGGYVRGKVHKGDKWTLKGNSDISMSAHSRVSADFELVVELTDNFVYFYEDIFESKFPTDEAIKDYAENNDMDAEADRDKIEQELQQLSYEDAVSNYKA